MLLVYAKSCGKAYSVAVSGRTGGNEFGVIEGAVGSSDFCGPDTQPYWFTCWRVSNKCKRQSSLMTVCVTLPVAPGTWKVSKLRPTTASLGRYL